jgi:DNA-binding response OmpR family regulator
MTQTSSPSPGADGRDRTATSRVLVIDDEATMRETVRYNLLREGYAVELAADGAAGLLAARATLPDLIVLDVMLPGMDGFQVCRTLRAESNVPILLLSARGEEIDRVLGLELGADDYLTKPFAMRELVARVKAMLRRAQMPSHAANGGGEGRGTSSKAVEPQTVVVGDLTVDAARRQARLAGEPLALKPREFDLLHYLASHPGLVLSRDALLREVWGYDYPVDTRTVDVHVRWLRQKVEIDPSDPRRIETVRGFGYRFVADPS